MRSVGDTTGPRRAVLAVVLAAVMIGSVTTAGVVLAQPASAAQTLSSCTTIDESGEYELASDIDAGGETCFEITASDVTLDGNGHTIAGAGGNERAFGVFVNGTESEVSNVTVTDMTVTRWFNGITVRSATDVTISGVSAIDDKYYGYWLVNTEEAVLEDSIARDHTRGEGEGVSIINSQNLLIDNTSIVDNQYGLHIDNTARDIRIVDSTISGNSNWGYYMRGYNDGSQPANVTATDLTLGDAVVDIVASQNVVLEGTDSLPAAPESGQTVGAPLRTSTAGGGAESALNLSVHYGDDAGVDESTLALQQYAQNEWSVASPDVVDADANTVTSPIEFTTNGAIYLSLVGEAAADGGEEPEPEPEPEPASFEVTNLDAPTNVTQGERAAVNVTVTNTGGVEATQTVEFRMDIDFDGDGTPETVTRNESVTLAPNASQTVTFAGPTDSYPVGTYTYEISTANDSVTSEVTIDAPESEPEPPETTYYQVDFVAGEPLEELGGDAPLYAAQDRLMRFAHGNTDEGITRKGSAWASEDVREAVDYGHIGMNDDGTASVTFTVADGENVTLSLAVYEKSGPGFNASETQTLIDASTETFGPGEHTITVSLPGSDDGNATADLTAQSIRATPVA